MLSDWLGAQNCDREPLLRAAKSKERHSMEFIDRGSETVAFVFLCCSQLTGGALELEYVDEQMTKGEFPFVFSFRFRFRSRSTCHNSSEFQAITFESSSSSSPSNK